MTVSQSGRKVSLIGLSYFPSEKQQQMIDENVTLGKIFQENCKKIGNQNTTKKGPLSYFRQEKKCIFLQVFTTTWERRGDFDWQQNFRYYISSTKYFEYGTK